MSSHDEEDSQQPPKKRERQSNWTEKEVELLITCLKSRPELSRGEIAPNGKYQSTKDLSKAWDTVADIISAEGHGIRRTGKNAKKKWADLKSRTKAKLQTHSKNRTLTGGGEEYTGHPLNNVNNMVLSLLGESSVYGLKGLDVFETGGKTDFNQFVPERPSISLRKATNTDKERSSTTLSEAQISPAFKSKKQVNASASTAINFGLIQNSQSESGPPKNTLKNLGSVEKSRKYISTSDRVTFDIDAQAQKIPVCHNKSDKRSVNKPVSQAKQKSLKPSTFRKHTSSPYSKKRTTHTKNKPNFQSPNQNGTRGDTATSPKIMFCQGSQEQSSQHTQYFVSPTSDHFLLSNRPVSPNISVSPVYDQGYDFHSLPDNQVVPENDSLSLSLGLNMYDSLSPDSNRGSPGSNRASPGSNRASPYSNRASPYSNRASIRAPSLSEHQPSPRPAQRDNTRPYLAP